MPEPISVTAGFGWTAAGAWASFLALVGIIVRQIGPWRKQSIDANQKLRDDLLRRVEKLERELDRKDALHNAERSADRHRLNNITQCFDAMVLLLEVAQDPEQVKSVVARVKEMRARQAEAEALEKAAIHAAQIADSQERDRYRTEASEAGRKNDAP